MKQSVLVKNILPFLQWYVLMILIAIITDYFLHRFHMVYVGRYLGYVGTGFVIFSFVYSLRKRKIIKAGSPKKLLVVHEYLAWTGSIMILVHAGIHFNALLPWLAIFMLLIAVATGLVGKFLLKEAIASLKGKKQVLIEKGLDEEEADRQLFFDSFTVDLMKKWRVVHMPVTFILAVLFLMHIITIIMYSA